MQALFKAAPGPGALELREVPRPVPAPDEVVVDVAGASICGSDLHIALWHPMARWTRPPVIMGHEFAGVVAEVGSSVVGFQPGDAVAVESVIYCGRCPPCRNGQSHVCNERQLFGLHRPGGLSEAVAVPEHLLHRVPVGLPVEYAALAEPTTVALHAVLLQPPTPGDTVLVTGPGPIGLVVGRIARAFGARVLISGTDADRAVRLPAAAELGLEALDPAVPLREALDRPVDLVLESSGSGAAIDDALHVVKHGGTITLIGMPSSAVNLNLAQALRAEIALRSSYCGTWPDFERALALLADGTVPAGALVAPYALGSAIQAFDDAAAQKVLKPLVLPNGTAGRAPRQGGPDGGGA